MNSKPIVVIKVDLEIIKPRIEVRELLDMFSNRLPDYHVFVIPNNVRGEEIDLLEFQVFYEKDQIPIDYEELKSLLLDQKSYNNG